MNRQIEERIWIVACFLWGAFSAALVAYTILFPRANLWRPLADTVFHLSGLAILAGVLAGPRFFTAAWFLTMLFQCGMLIWLGSLWIRNRGRMNVWVRWVPPAIFVIAIVATVLFNNHIGRVLEFG